MSASALLSETRWTGAVLVLSFVLFAIGGILPVIGDKGDPRIFTLPVKEHLMAVAANAGAWRWANIFMGTAAVVLLVGLSRLTTSLEAVNERALSRLGLLGWLMAAILWIIFSVFRIVVTMQAAHEMTMAGPTGIVPAYYEPLAQWAFGLFYISAMIGFLALTAYGGALLRIGRFPAWVGWATLGYSLGMLLLLLITGDTLPAFHYVPPLLIGILLVVYCW